MSESLPVYTADPMSELEVPAADPPQYLRRTMSQEAADLKALKAWAEKRDMMNGGAYMETFHIGGKTVTNGHIVDQDSTSHGSIGNADNYPSAAQDKEALDQRNQTLIQDDTRPSHQDNDSRAGVGKRISGFLKRISPAERAQQKAMAMTAEEEAADAKKYPMSEGTYGWEDYDPKKYATGPLYSSHKSALFVPPHTPPIDV
ncbi:hypothetical protein E4T43_00374 [Aureobasidium subglaciale]|nr:hypothetical protein E4T43_00374 [Aureobasidium subglaciale]